MSTSRIREDDLNACCIGTIPLYEGPEDDGTPLFCADCGTRMRKRNERWERWFYRNELPEGHPDRKRERKDTGPKMLAFGDVLPPPNATTETPAALRGDKIPFLERRKDD